ncbi:MAG: hypothetical protein ACREQ1_09165 [Woeseiaceae bacterium]
MNRYSRRADNAALTFVILWCAVTPAGAEPFIGQFELKTLESAPGSYEFQSQNAWSWDQPSRRIASGPDGTEFDENAVVRQRHAIELEMGLTQSVKMRIGAEFEKERLDEPATIPEANDFDDLSLTEVGAEVIAILAPRQGNGAGLGLVAELEGPIDREESNHLTLGPVVEFQSGRWLAAVVPMFVYAFGGEKEEGEESDNKWDFAYAAQVSYTFSESWTLAFEDYGTVDRLRNSGHPSASAELFGDFDQHRVGPVLYYSVGFDGSRSAAPSASGSAMSPVAGEEEEEATPTIGLGLLEGRNGNTPEHTLKLSLEVDF